MNRYLKLLLAGIILVLVGSGPLHAQFSGRSGVYGTGGGGSGSGFPVTSSQQISSGGSVTTQSGGTLNCAAGSTCTGQTASQLDGSSKFSTTLYVDTAVANAIAGVNPAIAVLAASIGSNVVGTYAQVGGGVGDTFTVTATGAFSLDGISINTIGQRVLLKDQTAANQNGIYTATVVGTTGVSAVFTRATDYDTPGDVNNTGTVPVQSGTVNTTTSWLLTSQVTSIGSSGSSLVYTQFSLNPSTIAKKDLSNLANPTTMQAGQQLCSLDTGGPCLLYGSNLITSNVNITAPQFNGALHGNADTATTATVATNLASYPSLCAGSNFSQGLSSGSNNCNPPVVANPVQTGLLAEYQILPTESPCSLVDYSGNGNNASGTCTGTAPTIVAGTGGMIGGAGAVNLPSGLNSARTVFLYIADYHSNGTLLAGNGAASSSVLLMSSSVAQSATETGVGPFEAAGLAAYIISGLVNSGNNFAAFPRAQIYGNVSLAWVMGTPATTDTVAEQIFINGVNANGYWYGGATGAQGTGGYQTTGNFQLGGISSCGNWNSCGYYANSGIIYYAIFYSTQLNSSQIAAVNQYMTNRMAARGVVTTTGGGQGSSTTKSQLVADGDSITWGLGVTYPWPFLLASYIGPQNYQGTSWTYDNMARAGTNCQAQAGTFGSIALGFSQAVQPIIQAFYPARVYIPWCGTNDGAVTAEPGLQNICAQAHAASAKCFPITMLSRTAEDTWKNTLNTWMRTTWPQWADGIIDVAADPAVGADGAYSSALYFQSDHIHPTQPAIWNQVTGVVKRVVDANLGNVSWLTASVYSSAAPAANVPTACSEGGSGGGFGNTVTVTSTLNPVQNQYVYWSGATPSGYNSGIGGWLIKTTTGSNFTFYSPTANPGACTVMGTVVSPQQQSVDDHTILNISGGGNFTILPCVGLSGHVLSYWNEGASNDTLVAFGTDLINGSATYTLNANSKIGLLDVPGASSSAGCSWQTVPVN